MKKLKRLLALSVLLAVATTVTACSRDEKTVAMGSPTPPALEEYDDAIVVVAIPSAESVEDLEVKVEPDPPTLGRYADISISDAELEELAAIVYLESGNQTAEGQQAVVEVILNRVNSADFPDNVHDVLYQGAGTDVPQFSTIFIIDTAEHGQAQYDAINTALYGPSVLPADVLYFSTGGENDRVWGQIGAHVFCYGYVWE